jgi:hypothetical protein
MLPKSFREELKSLDWKIREKEDSAELEKGPSLTTMTAKAAIRKRPNGNYDYAVALYTPDGEMIEGFVGSNDRFRSFSRVICGRIESYLSGITEVLEILQYFRKYRVKAIKQ